MGSIQMEERGNSRYDAFRNLMRLSWSPMMDSSSSPIVHTTGAHCLKIMTEIVGYQEWVSGEKDENLARW